MGAARVGTVRSILTSGRHKAPKIGGTPPGNWSSTIGNVEGGRSMSSDYSELLRLLVEFNVRFLVVGGYAVMEYAEPRYTKDLDLLIATDPANAEAVFSALAKFGAPLTGLRPSDFTDPDAFYKMGSPPLRVDVLMSIPGVDFEEAWSDRKEVSMFGIDVPLISKRHLIASKQASGRPTDLIDLAALEDPKELS